jgi:predicted dehydrogenase
MDAVRLGLLGCASVATRRILPALPSAGITLVAVASRSPGRADDVAGRFGGRAVATYDDVLAAPDVEAVYLPLPSGLHAEWIARTLAAGKHVLAEKPLTTSAADTARLLAEADRRRLVLRENYMFPHHSQHRHVRRMLADGAIGDLRAFSAAFTIPPRPDDDIRYRSELGGGALLDVAGYPVRAATMLLGPHLTVAGAALRVDPVRGVDLGGGALLRRADGVHAHLTFGLEHSYVSAFELIGGTGRIRVEHAYTPPADHVPTVYLNGRACPLPPDDQVTNRLRAFATEVRSGPDRDSGDTGDAIRGQARLIDAIRRAAGP